MRITLSVRLPAALVQRLDEEVDAGPGGTRSDIVTRALEREFRRLSAADDASILSWTNEADEALTVVPRRAWVE